MGRIFCPAGPRRPRPKMALTGPRLPPKLPPRVSSGVPWCAMSSPSPSVLIVDSSAENREVLRTVLQRRGLRIFEADEPERGLELAREHHPDVIVLDLESRPTIGGDVEDRFGAEAHEQHASLVLLGQAGNPHAATTKVVAKPYHFAPLVHTIQQLAAKAA